MAENITAWQSHRAAPGDLYQLAYTSMDRGAVHDTGDFKDVLKQRRNLNVRGAYLAGNTVIVTVETLAALPLLSILGGPHVVSGKGNGKYDYVLASVSLTRKSNVVYGAVAPIARAVESALDRSGNASLQRQLELGAAAGNVRDTLANPFGGTRTLLYVAGGFAAVALLVAVSD